MLGWALRLAASAAFVALALGLAGLGRPGLFRDMDDDLFAIAYAGIYGIMTGVALR